MNWQKMGREKPQERLGESDTDKDKLIKIKGQLPKVEEK